MRLGESGADRIRFVFSEGEYDVVPVLSEILLNPVELCQMEQIGERILGEGTGFPNQRFPLESAGTIPASVELEAEAPEHPGIFEPWRRVRDFSDQSRKTDILWSTERVEISALEMESTDCRRKESSV